MKTIRLTLFIAAVAIVSLFSGCASTMPVFLHISQPTTPSSSAGTEAILIDPFKEHPALQERIGEFLSWMNRRDIRIAPGTAGNGLSTRIHKLLVDKNARRTETPAWDRTIAGMQSLSPSVRLVLAGDIKDMRLLSTKKIMHTIYTLELDVDCLIGQTAKKTVVTRRIQVNLDTTKPLQNEVELAALINQGLDEVAKRVISEIGAATNN